MGTLIEEEMLSRDSHLEPAGKCGNSCHGYNRTKEIFPFLFKKERVLVISFGESRDWCNDFPNVRKRLTSLEAYYCTKKGAFYQHLSFQRSLQIKLAGFPRTESRKSHGSTAVSRRKASLIYASFEERPVILKEISCEETSDACK